MTSSFSPAEESSTATPQRTSSTPTRNSAKHMKKTSSSSSDNILSYFGLGHDQTSSYTSLFSLLQPIEFIFSVDNSVLWQRHVSWAKPNGSDLRQYYTQRYSSTLAFLSFMLSGEIGVFFNSSRRMTEMRDILESSTYDSLLYWIGLVMLLNIVVTVVGVVSTFTAWGMVLSISDRNAHALLRSSIGLYVIGLPPRYVVASLYLYLAWVIMWMLFLISGFVQFIMVGITFALFFQVIAPLSAFGRLIMLTGAMSSKPVIHDEKLEKQLLPSGLHSALLIKATLRRRRNTCVTEQYRRTSNFSYDEDSDEQTYSSLLLSASSTKSTASTVGTTSRTLVSEDKEKVSSSIDSSSKPEEDESSSSSSSHKQQAAAYKAKRRGSQHNRFMSRDLSLPSAAILNNTISKEDLEELVDTTLPAYLGGDDTSTIQEEEEEMVAEEKGEEIVSSAMINDLEAPPNNELQTQGLQQPQLPPSHPLLSRKSIQKFGSNHKIGLPPFGSRNDSSDSLKAKSKKWQQKQHHRKSSSKHLFDEWCSDNNIRDLYEEDFVPTLPDELTLEHDYETYSSSFKDKSDNDSSRSHLHHNSMLRNRHKKNYHTNNSNTRPPSSPPRHQQQQQQQQQQPNATTDKTRTVTNDVFADHINAININIDAEETTSLLAKSDKSQSSYS